MKKQIILFLGIILAVPTFAQNQERMREGGPDKRQMNEEKRKEIEAQRVAYITTQLELTPEESKAFWPVYNEYQKTVEKHREFRSEFKKPMKDMSELSDAEVDELLRAQFAYERSSIDIEEVYYGRFKQVLPMKKVARFYEAERGFKKQLLRSLKGKNAKGSDMRMQAAPNQSISAPSN
jgi:hypothetical protein